MCRQLYIDASKHSNVHIYIYVCVSVYIHTHIYIYITCLMHGFIYWIYMKTGFVFTHAGFDYLSLSCCHLPNHAPVPCPT